MSELLINDDFFLCENRKGFRVSELMKRSWAANLKILEDVKEVCEKNSLRVFASYGTLLGAVRDGGYIAWDDDIDLGFLGNDYIKFLNLFNQELGDRYNILNPYTRPWFHMNFSHMTNGDKVRFDREYLNEWFGCPFMMGPDIFPFYFVPRNKSDREYIVNMLKKIDYTIALVYRSKKISEGFGKLSEKDSIIKELSLNLLELSQETGYSFSNDRPLDNQLEILYDQVCRLTEENEADYVTRYNVYTKNPNYIIPKGCFDEIVPLKFEMITVPVPKRYDEILKICIGKDYMIPKREGADHEYPFFKKQLKDTIDYIGTGEQTLSNNSIKLNSFDKAQITENDKTLVLFHTSIRHMLLESEYVIEKIRSVIEYSLNNQDKMRLIWIPDFFSKSNVNAMDLIAPHLIEEYENIICQYKNRGGFVLNKSDCTEEIASKICEYYGDDDDLVNLFQSLKKNITIQNYKIPKFEISI